MSQIVVHGTDPGSMLTAILCADDIVPGADPSYQLCKTIYLAHPLGAKMVDSPVKLAMSRPRQITVSDAPGDDVRDAFVDEWKRMRCDSVIAQHASVTRIYGLGAIILGCVGKESNKALEAEDLYKKELFLNVVDPLNTAGSISMDQDANSPTFQKWTAIAVSGQTYHRSRASVLMNEAPVYIAYTTSAFSFSGRSVYQRALFPLKSFIQSMVTDDMVTKKAGLLIAKINPVGAIIDNIMAAFASMKRQLLQAGATGGVVSINTGNGVLQDESIESLNLQNIDGAGGWARGNVLKNIATAGDMPAWFLENETLTSGFGEGTEDAENILRYIDGIREWLQGDYDFLDPLVQQRAWNPDFFAIMQTNYPAVYGKMTYDQAFYRWRNSFVATWPNLRKEPESEAVKTEKVKLEGVISAIQVLAPFLDPDSLGAMIQWACDTINANKTLFPSPLKFDIDDVIDYLAAKAMTAAAGNDDDEGAQSPPAGKPKLLSIKDSVGTREHAALRVLEDFRDRRAS